MFLNDLAAKDEVTEETEENEADADEATKSVDSNTKSLSHDEIMLLPRSKPKKIVFTPKTSGTKHVTFKHKQEKKNLKAIETLNLADEIEVIKEDEMNGGAEESGAEEENYDIVSVREVHAKNRDIKSLEELLSTLRKNKNQNLSAVV